mmetsp:Transcript_15182/g.30010  ORF Transcript_15182/g.30010 Transcript_15182/m.30010 type:complete len:270 (+) Transcript_15182:861-1670(+)
MTLVVAHPKLRALLIGAQPDAPRGLVCRRVAVHRPVCRPVVVCCVVFAPMVARLVAPLLIPLNAAHEQPKRRLGPLVAHNQLVLPVVGRAHGAVGSHLVGHPAAPPEVCTAALEVILVSLRLPKAEDLLLARQRPCELLAAHRVPLPRGLVRDRDVVAIAEHRELRILKADRRRHQVLPAVARHREVDIALPRRRLVREVGLLVLVRRAVEGLALLQVAVGALCLGMVNVDELVEWRVLTVGGVPVALVGLAGVVLKLRLVGERHVCVL